MKNRKSAGNEIHCSMCRRTTGSKCYQILLSESLEPVIKDRRGKYVPAGDEGSDCFVGVAEAYIPIVCDECADVFETLFHRFVDPDSPHRNKLW
jgi:hypothetical protein